MQIGKWRVFLNCRWYKGEPFAGFLLKLGEIVKDYPAGWESITFLEIQVGKFIVVFGISNL